MPMDCKMLLTMLIINEYIMNKDKLESKLSEGSDLNRRKMTHLQAT